MRPVVQTRRRFLQSSALSVVGLALAGPARAARRWPPRRKALRIGVIGVANRGASNLSGVSGEDIVALCDIDRRYLEKAAEQHPGARPFADFRDLLKVERSRRHL